MNINATNMGSEIFNQAKFLKTEFPNFEIWHLDALFFWQRFQIGKMAFITPKAYAIPTNCQKTIIVVVCLTYFTSIFTI